MEKESLNIGHLSTAYHSNFIIMSNDDLDKDLNKKINWSIFGTGPLMVEAFSQGKLDIGYMGLPPGIIGIDKGVPIKCVAGGHVEGTIMIGKKGYKEISQFNDNMYDVLAQFRGKAIGTPSVGSIHDAIINFYLEKTGLNDDVEVKNYPQAEFIAIDMKDGILEGGVGTPALAVFASTILESHLIIPPDNLLPYNPSYGIFFHEDLIKNHPETVTKFLLHHKKASDLLRNSPEKAAKKITKTFPIINKEYVKSVLEISPKYCIALPEEYLTSTAGFVNTLHKLGYIKKKLETNEIFNFKFVEKIHPENHHYVRN